ncbi:MAG TPA: fibrobacter succinogenes major paralogous domain-containing protein [Saprospiraceae bacterium]|nr:fibrobacter succinogenes major paralogous domain-containing protein [Saprospiraceae bacterium]
MLNLTPTEPSFVFGYWRPWKENSNAFDSYLDYRKDVTLAKYQADTVGSYIRQASTEQVQAISDLGQKIGIDISQASERQVQAIGELGQQIGIDINQASERQVQAMSELGQQIGIGLNILSCQMADLNQQLAFINKNLDIQIGQQKVTNLLLENIGELLRVPDSEKERQHCIELGLKFFVNAQKDDDLFTDALEELIEAEKLMRQDYFVLHHIGLIYMHSLKHINPQMALDYFARAAKYASVESDPKAVRLANVLAQNGSRINTKVVTDTNSIESLAANSYEKAAFAAYVLGDFELAVLHQSKAVKYNNSAENHFFLAKYQTRTKQIDLCIQNLEKSIDGAPEMALAVFKDLDLVDEIGVLKFLEEKNTIVDEEIQQLLKELEIVQSNFAMKLIEELKSSKYSAYDKKVKKVRKVRKIRGIELKDLETENLDEFYFRNDDEILEAKSDAEWTKAGNEWKPAWCYYENDPENGKKYGKLYNWYAVNDPRGLAPEGWHIPSKVEWEVLIEILGDPKLVGKKLKNSFGWNRDEHRNNDGNGTNESGFAGLPGGSRESNGEYIKLLAENFPRTIGDYGVWWTSTEAQEDKAWNILLCNFYDGFSIHHNLMGCGYSVRCFKNLVES